MRPVGEKGDSNTRHLRGLPKPFDIRGRHGAPVIGRTRRLPHRDGRKQRVSAGFTLGKGVAHPAAVGVYLQFARPPSRGRSDHQILRGTAKADEEMMIIGIDGRRLARKIGQDVDRRLPDTKPPGLGVVAVRSKRRIPDDVRHVGIGRKRRTHPGSISVIVDD